MKPVDYYTLFFRYDESVSNPIYQKKFIVFASNLLSLFLNCFMCHCPAEVSLETIGTFLRVKLFCPSCLFNYVWESQPLIGDMPAGNLALSTAIICSGSLPSKVIQMFRFMNCETISDTTFFNYQSKYLHPAISMTWEKHQQEILSSFKTEKNVGGDARCDSPGYCAKFGSYTLHELKYNVIIDVELVQVS